MPFTEVTTPFLSTILREANTCLNSPVTTDPTTTFSTLSKASFQRLIALE